MPFFFFAGIYIIDMLIVTPPILRLCYDTSRHEILLMCHYDISLDFTGDTIMPATRWPPPYQMSATLRSHDAAMLAIMSCLLRYQPRHLPQPMSFVISQLSRRYAS